MLQNIGVKKHSLTLSKSFLGNLRNKTVNSLVYNYIKYHNYRDLT